MKTCIMWKTSLSILLFICSISIKAQNTLYAGGDISMLPQYEKGLSGYLDGLGHEIDDLIPWLHNDCGWNTFRVRLFVNPADPNFEGVVQDIEYVKALGKRIKDEGCKLMLDLHYSDTWADATHIQAPASWSDCKTPEQKAERLGTYTRETLQTLKDAGAEPDLVQIGNEIMYGFVGIKVAPYDKADSDWDGFLKVLKAGSAAVREVCPEARIIIHTDRPTNRAYNEYFYGKLAELDYDVIGLSYYPFWHGYLSGTTDGSGNNLSLALADLKAKFPDKKVQIVETAYNFQWWPSSGVNYDTRSIWPCSVDGQYKFVKELVEELGRHDNVEGVSYWFPEEAGCGDYVNWTTNEGIVIKNWLNRGMWYEDEAKKGHWPLKTTDGNMVHYLFANYIDPSHTGIDANTFTPAPAADNVYTLDGRCLGNKPASALSKGLYIKNNKKYNIQ